eukprot:8708789-Pyramimonas_sp.AAC.1
MASLRMRVAGGIVRVISACARTNEHDYEIRCDCYADLPAFASAGRSREPPVILGDFNARLLDGRSGESAVLGLGAYIGPGTSYINVLHVRSMCRE